MRPIKNGSSKEFWWYACGVNVEGIDYENIGDTYLPRDGWYIYYHQGFHGQFVYRVSEKQVLKDYPAVLKEIETWRITDKTSPYSARTKQVLKANRQNILDNPNRFLLLLHEAKLADLKVNEKEGYNYSIVEEQDFSERWNRMQGYWVNLVFEFCYLMALFFFLLYPWLWKKPRWSWSLHIGLSPFLLFLPFYLGYARFTFSSAGPSGGVLYPWLICWARVPLWTPTDSWIVDSLPPILEPISQTPGPMLSISSGNTMGPVAAIILGAILAFGSFCYHRYLPKKIQEKDHSPMIQA